MRMLYLMGLLACSIMLHASVLHAQEQARLRHYIPDSRYIYYNDRSITMQAARFELPAPGFIREVRLTVDGGRSSSALLHIFGEEGGKNAPVLEIDLTSPIPVQKTKSGLEQITVTLPEPIYIGGEQFFVALDNIRSGMRLLSDRKAKRPGCVAGVEPYYYQFLREKNGEWKWGKFGFAIDVDVEYRKMTGSAKFSDATELLFKSDSSIWNNGICWSDINGDRYLDLLAGGRLYRNDGGQTFTDITASAGLSGKPASQAFIDANNDGAIDILFFSTADSSSGTHALFIGRGDGVFDRSAVDLPGATTPQCFAIADVNSDGYLDLYVGQRNDVSGIGHNLLYLNTRRTGFVRDTAAFLPEPAIHGVAAAQWVDIDGDGGQELFTAGAPGSIDILWRLDSAGGFRPFALHEDGWHGVGCSWADFDNDGDLDLLLPKSIDHREFRRSDGEPARFIYENEIAAAHDVISNDLFRRRVSVSDMRYISERAGGAWGDIDNDGLQEFILASSCRCSYINIYMQTSEGEFEDRTFDCGLRRIAAGEDAVWADFDNDGRLDLSAIRDGRIAIYRNESATTNNYAAIELTDQNGREESVGAMVTLFAGGRKYTRAVTSGRGLGMQDPTRLHFGIGSATTIDSVVVHPPSSSGVVTYTDLAINRLHRLVVDRTRITGAEVSIRLSVAPNPFTDRLRFTYSLARREHVRLEVYSSSGERVGIVVDEEQGAGDHAITWEAKDETGKRLPQGSYLYRIITRHGEASGKVQLRL